MNYVVVLLEGATELQSWLNANSANTIVAITQAGDWYTVISTTP